MVRRVGRGQGGLPLRFFFFNDTATTEIYTLSLHDALPIWTPPRSERAPRSGVSDATSSPSSASSFPSACLCLWPWRSEEHTSELQSQSNLVCRLLLEKKKRNSAVTYTDIFITPTQDPRGHI